MSILAQRFIHPELVHEDEAKAVGERPQAVNVFDKQALRLFEPLHIHQDDSARFGGRHRMEQRRD